MSFILSILFGGFKWLKEAISALLGLVRRYPWHAALCAVVVLLWLQNGTLNGVRKDLLAMTQARDAEQAAHRGTISNYNKAATEAFARMKLNQKRVLKEQEQINEKHVAILESKWIANQSRADRLRESSEAYSRRADETGMSAAMEAACQAHAGTGCERIPTLLKAAQDNTDQLIQLQKAALEQGAIDINNPY